MNDLEQTAIERLKTASGFSLKLYKVPLLITYSGGKDSDVLLRLAENSGIPFEVLHTALPPPMPRKQCITSAIPSAALRRRASSAR